MKNMRGNLCGVALAAIVLAAYNIHAGSSTVQTDSIAYSHQKTVTIGTQLLGIGYNCYPNFPDSVVRKGDRFKIQFQWKRQGQDFFCDTTITVIVKSNGIDTINSGRGYRPYFQYGLLPR